MFHGIILTDESFDVTICNPPFHASQAEAQAGTMRKLSNLNKQKVAEPILNFGGQQNELICKGGEARFLTDLIHESKHFPISCFWFTSIVSKQSNLTKVYALLKQVGAEEVKTIPMGQGNKTSRIVAWTFLNKEEQQWWANNKWKNNKSKF